MTRPFAAVVVTCVLSASGAGAQTGDTLRLGALQAHAIRVDPRAAQLELAARQSALRLRNLDAERRPAMSVEGLAQYQSDVPHIPSALPGGPPPPPHDTYDARLATTMRIVDPALSARRAVEQADRARAEARVRVALHGTRRQLNDAYFSALRAQVHQDELTAAVTALEAQLAVAAVRVREGAALASEEHTIRAELLRMRQVLAETDITRAAALAVLADIVALRIDSGTPLAVPDLADEVAAERALVPDLRARPEFTELELSRAVLARQEEARTAQELPRLSAFARAGYGRPGLNPLASAFDTYWLAGVQLQWNPWTWGTSARDREVLAVQRQIVQTEEQAFAEQLARSATLELASIERLEAALALDDEIIALRQHILTETSARYAEAAVTSAEYVTRQSEFLTARTARAIHRVELAQARARFLTTLGLEVR